MEELIGIIGTVMALGIPIVAILTSHQRKMAEILNPNRSEMQGQMAGELQRQINELRQQIAVLQAQLPQPTVSQTYSHLQPPPTPMSVENPNNLNQY